MTGRAMARGRVGLERAAALALAADDRYGILLETGVLELGYYAPRDQDPQSPHDRDEVYVVARGHGFLDLEGERHEARPGDVLKVPAGDAHRFVDFSADFGTWVVFWREGAATRAGPTVRERDAYAARRRLLRAWRFLGPGLLALLAGLAAWLATTRPLLVIPLAVAHRLEDGTLADSTLVVMAALLPAAVVGCLFLAVALVGVAWSAAARERRLIARLLGREDGGHLLP